MKKILVLQIILLFFVFKLAYSQTVELSEDNLDKSLVAILDTIYEDDQKYRVELMKIIEEYGWVNDKIELVELSATIKEKDSINLIKIEKILNEHGWLGADIIGERGNSTLFLVIQHSDLNTQEKYLPMIKDAVKIGNAKGNDLALLEDRIALRKGEKQIYGSQVGFDSETNEYYVLPLIDPENVDKRRLEVGLSPIQDYLSTFNLTWDVEEYIKNLPIYEAKQRQ